MKPEQLDMLQSPQDRAKPWREAAKAAENNFLLPEWDRNYNTRYYTEMADKIERGEA